MRIASIWSKPDRHLARCRPGYVEQHDDSGWSVFLDEHMIEGQGG